MNEPIIFYFDDLPAPKRIRITRISMVTAKLNPVILCVDHAIFSLRSGANRTSDFFSLN